MSQSSTLSVNMVKERLPKCYLNLSDDDEGNSIFIRPISNFKMCAMPLIADDGHGGAVDTDSKE